MTPLRILLVEDNPDNCMIAVAYMEGTPYRIEVAENGEIACDMFAAGEYDLVLMDRQMPIMDGLTATRTIRAWEAANDRSPTPIIALTASALKGDRETCLAAGCTSFLTKPIKQEVLLRAIKDRFLVGLSAPIAPSTLAEPDPESVHSSLKARIPAFLLNRRHDVVSMLKALTRGDFETVERLGHGMKGAGVSFGFPPISDIGTGLELEAGVRNIDAARHWVDELTAFLDSIGTGLDYLARTDGGEVATALHDIAPMAGGPRRIVLVEDQEDLRGLMRELMEGMGHQVVDVGDGLEGVARILTEKPDIAIIDIGLPTIDGFEVARRVRAVLGNAVVLVALTGHSRESARTAALAAGFDAHIVKPVSAALIAQILETQRLIA